MRKCKGKGYGILILKVCLLCLLVASLFTGSMPFGVKGFDYPLYETSLKAKDWFVEIYMEMKPVVHSCLNATSWFLETGNFTSAGYVYAIRRWSLALYTMATSLMYEFTNDKQYLAETKWLIDNWLAHEGEGASYSKTWRLETRTTAHGWFYIDTAVWFAMQKLNENGYSYDVIGRIDSAINIAKYNNSTDLGWEYYYWQQTGNPTGYVVNTFMPMMWIMSYLTNKGVKDYTNAVQRIYTVLEKFRRGNEYAYNFADTIGQSHYTIVILDFLLMSKKYLPNVFNNTKIQATINSVDTETKVKSGAPMEAAILPFFAQHLGFTTGWNFNQRVVSVRADTRNQSKEKTFTKTTKELELKEFGNVFYLGQIPDVIFTLPPMTQTTYLNKYHYNFTGQLQTTAYEFTSVYSTLCNPVISGNWWTSETYAVAGGTWSAPTFDTTTNVWKSNNFAYDEKTVNFTFNKRLTNWNFSASGKVRWKLWNFKYYFDTYEHRFIFPNGTITLIPKGNYTWNVGTIFAMELTSGRDWFLFKIDNSTLIEYRGYDVSNDFGYYYTSVSSLAMWKVYTPVSLSTSYDWQTMRNNIIGMLQKIQANQMPILYDDVKPKTKGRIIHSDANISDYNDQISSQNKLSFTLSYGSGQTSTTKVYVGDKGEPKTVNGTTSWSYNSSSNILTITALHSSSTTITVRWALPGDVNNDGTVNASDLFALSQAFGSTDGPPPSADWNPDADLNKDNNINILDLYILGKNYGKTNP